MENCLSLIFNVSGFIGWKNVHALHLGSHEDMKIGWWRKSRSPVCDFYKLFKYFFWRNTDKNIVTSSHPFIVNHWILCKNLFKKFSINLWIIYLEIIFMEGSSYKVLFEKTHQVFLQFFNVYFWMNYRDLEMARIELASKT